MLRLVASGSGPRPVSGLASSFESRRTPGPRVRVGAGDVVSYSIDAIPDIVTVMGRDGRVMYTNAAAGRLLGYDPIELGERWVEFVHPDDLAAVLGEVARLLATPGLRRTFTLRMAHANGSWLHLETLGTNLFDDPQIGALVLHSHDVTGGHLAEGRLAHERLHDRLTGFPTRGLFIEHLQRALFRAARLHSTLAVFGVDLDGLSLVNARHGYDRGDALLRRVGQDLEGVLRADDTVARSDAVIARFEDSFFVLYEDIGDPAAAAVIAARLCAAVPEPVDPGTDGVVATATVGVVLNGSGTWDAESLLVHATNAMHVGKAGGGNRVEFFDPDIGQDADRRLADLNDLRAGIVGNQFQLVYQPQFDIVSGNLRAVEALARWQHPTRGQVSPAEFIPLAEDTGLIQPLGEWVLTEACRQRASWSPLFDDPTGLLMCVNVSSHQFNSSFPDLVERVLADTKAPPASLCVEVTESAVMADVEDAIVTMRRLQDLGVQISIDDFGTGYSSLAQLKRLPFDELKIDQCFVARLGESREDTAIATAIVVMAHALGLPVVAEGVEKPEQLAQLRLLGCDVAQGFLFSRPVPASDIDTLLHVSAECAHRPAVVPSQ